MVALVRAALEKAFGRSYYVREEKPIALDRLRKGRLYARAAVADYCVINLIDEVVEVYRERVRAPPGQDVWKNGVVQLLRRHAVVTPLAAPRARIRVAALLP